MNGMKLRLAGVAALAMTVLVGMLATNALSASSSRTIALPTKITVTAGEFYFTLSKKSITKPGIVIFSVVNKGKIAHDFSIPSLHKSTRLLQPGSKQLLTVRFAKAGSFYYLCTVPRHAQEGMAGSFIVK
jgi:uncharacterized cupredoxin-like copper-binding protein